jgi:hypothetical protein
MGRMLSLETPTIVQWQVCTPASGTLPPFWPIEVRVREQCHFRRTGVLEPRAKR